MNLRSCSVGTSDEMDFLIFRWHGSRWHDIYTKSFDDQFRYSSNNKGVTTTIWEAVMLVLMMKGICDGRRWDGHRWHDIHTKSCDDQFRYSCNDKGITTTIWEAVMLVLMMKRIWMYVFELASGCMIYTYKFLWRLAQTFKQYLGFFPEIWEASMLVLLM
jgi:hypothetical protein